MDDMAAWYPDIVPWRWCLVIVGTGLINKLVCGLCLYCRMLRFKLCHPNYWILCHPWGLLHGVTSILITDEYIAGSLDFFLLELGLLTLVAVFVSSIDLWSGFLKPLVRTVRSLIVCLLLLNLRLIFIPMNPKRVWNGRFCLPEQNRQLLSVTMHTVALRRNPGQNSKHGNFANTDEFNFAVSCIPFSDISHSVKVWRRSVRQFWSYIDFCDFTTRRFR